MFVDRAKIYVNGGNGGDGCVAFRREKFVPRGGPSGGDGGKGGDVFIQTSTHLNTLLSFRFNQHYRAERGRHGSGKNRHGKSGNDLIIEVPVGTQIFDEESGELLHDLTKPNHRECVARGGMGGRGNARFTTSTNQAPRLCEPGRSGETRILRLVLKVLADVGLIGYPNAGKSTLISVISSARPKIADYPFTTLSPNLGVVSLGEYRTVVVADIPGLIEGAHEGSGLGDHFLRHIERCKILIHLIDVTQSGEADPIHAHEVINGELRAYDPELGEKQQIIAASKIDSAEPRKLARLRDFCRSKGHLFLEISAVSGKGIDTLKNTISGLIERDSDG